MSFELLIKIASFSSVVKFFFAAIVSFPLQELFYHVVRFGPILLRGQQGSMGKIQAYGLICPFLPIMSAS
jgi:hypothetical protein